MTAQAGTTVRVLRVERAAGRRVAVLAVTDRNVASIHRITLDESACPSCTVCDGCRCALPCMDSTPCTCPRLFGVDPAGGRAG